MAKTKKVGSLWYSEGEYNMLYERFIAADSKAIVLQEEKEQLEKHLEIAQARAAIFHSFLTDLGCIVYEDFLPTPQA